jgi:hypothetical protein
MGIDTWKVLFTYGIAGVIVIGGFLTIYFLPDGDGRIAIITGFVGAALQFVFNRETQTQTARQTERATSIGSTGMAPPPEAS